MNSAALKLTVANVNNWQKAGVDFEYSNYCNLSVAAGVRFERTHPHWQQAVIASSAFSWPFLQLRGEILLDHPPKNLEPFLSICFHVIRILTRTERVTTAHVRRFCFGVYGAGGLPVQHAIVSRG